MKAICVDAEIMTWSAKAQELIGTQYAPTGAAGLAALDPLSSGPPESQPSPAGVIPV
jgi:hypothetical protein